MPTLDFTALKGNANAKVILAHPTGGTFVGYRQEDFTLSLQAQYGAKFENAMQEQSSTLNTGISALNNWSGGLFNIPNVNLTNQAQTLYEWNASQRPPIPIQLTIVRHSLSETPVTQVAKNLLKHLLPRKGVGDLLKAPGEYNAGMGTGMWTVQVGQYFKATQLVLTQGNAAFAPVDVSDGTPLYANLSLTFEPYKLPTEDEFEQYFLR